MCVVMNIRPDLGKNKTKLLLLGAVYFVFETALELVIRYGQTNAVAQKWRMFLSFPVALLNAITYWWIFFALYRLTAQLATRKQLLKLQLYKRFSSVLMFSLIAAVVFALYQMYAHLTRYALSASTTLTTCFVLVCQVLFSDQSTNITLVVNMVVGWRILSYFIHFNLTVDCVFMASIDSFATICLFAGQSR